MNHEDKKLKLPKTNFPMKSGLTELTPKIIKFWNDNNVRELIKKSKNDCPSFIMHFGPPYTNGKLHIGHGFNITLKDLVMRISSFLGYNIENKTGHDCHGLPIELAVKKTISEAPKTIKEFVKICNEFAEKYIKIQQETMEKMGILKENGYYTTFDSVKEIYEVFSELLMSDLVYVDKKPCAWSITEKTVISDAEIIYNTKTSRTVDVALEITDSPIANFKGKFICIWTTTPWTLIDNVAVAYNKNHNYILCEAGEKIIIIGEKIQESFSERTNIEINPLGVISGEIFLDMQCRHPILGHSVPLLHSDHVEEDSGTGFVHIAPAHGIEDFELCKKNNIDVIESVDDAGFYYENVEILGGKHIFGNEEDILETIEGKLLQVSTIEHEYPYDTRGSDIKLGDKFIKGTPIIYRATEQVFIDIHQIDFDKMTSNIKNLITRPDHLKEAFSETIKKRKEWCVSRNRILGVPVAMFINKKTDEILKNQTLQEKILKQMEIDPYYFLKDECIDILDGIVDKQEYRPKCCILDVWFDSGCVAYFLSKYFDRKCQYEVADVYVEGKDQIRGWFQSSGLLSWLMEKRLPYKAIVSHGFVVDEKGNKMSKSKGNVVDLEELMDKYGIEIIRLWVMTSDYTDDIAIGPVILEKTCEIYRKIRNVLRFLISISENENIDELFNDFQYLEKVFFNEFIEMKDSYIEHLKVYNYRKAFDEIYTFIHRISELYFNARKDTLYCDDENDIERKSTVNFMYFLLYHLTILLSPILPITMEEIFQYSNKFNTKKTSICEFDIRDLKNNKIKTEKDIEIKTLENQMEIFRKMIEDAKQQGICNKNTDIIVFIKDEIKQPKDVLAKLLGVLDIKIGNEDKIEISDLYPCWRCGKKNCTELKNEKYICKRCQNIMS